MKQKKMFRRIIYIGRTAINKRNYEKNVHLIQGKIKLGQK